MACFCTLKGHTSTESTSISVSLKTHIRAQIGAFASPKLVIIVPDLPKTRSGKIMRRILRKIASGELKSLDDTDNVLGDLSTLAEPAVIPKLLEGYMSCL